MQCIDMTFNDFLQKHFRFACDISHNTNAIDEGNCIALVLLDYAFCNAELEACMPLLHKFFKMKPCLRQVNPFSSFTPQVGGKISWPAFCHCV